MKKFDVKKLLVLILIIAALIAIAFIGFKAVNKDKLTKENKTEVEANISSYYLNLTKGYSTTYGGLDVLYSYDKTTYEDLSEQEIVYTAATYLSDSDINYTIDAAAMTQLSDSGKYGNLNDYRIYSGESVRQAVKDLFGADTIPSTPAPENYVFDIIYDVNTDCYLITKNDIEDNETSEASMDFSIISTESKDGKVITTVAIAYVYDDEGNIMYMKDPAGEKVVVENLEKEEFPKDKIDEFDKYKFTLKESSDKKYVFESVEKVK